MLNNLPIGKRLALGFGLLLALCCAVSGMASFQMSRLADNARYYVVNLVPSYEAEHEISLGLGDIRRFEYRHVLSNTKEDMDKMESKISESRRKIGEAVDRYAKDLVSDDKDRQLLEAARTALQAYYAVWDRQVVTVSRATTADPTKTAEATQLMVGPGSAAYEAAHAAVQAWWNYNVELSRQQAIASDATASSAQLTMGAAALVCLALGVGAAVLMTRSVTTPLKRATEVARAVAAGDLTSRVEVQGRDETAELLAALRDMNDNLARIVGQVRNSSDSIATGSSQIAAGNSDLSQRTEEQASNLEQTAASMEQLSGTVRNNADTARQANELATSASQAASHGGDVVQQVVTTMRDISASSRKIADIIGTIDGIAFQTNILALNAAVEAARAGEQGRGFAVVASEVRNLASRAADAAKEIKSLIQASVERVEAGTQLVNTAGESMTEIVSQVHRVGQMISEISSASVEQSRGIEQVGEAVTQLDHVTQQNAALVEESAAAAESLRHQSSRLAEVVREFRLDTAHGSSPVSAASSTTASGVASPGLVVKKPLPVVSGQPTSSARPLTATPAPALANANADEWDTF